MGVGLVRSLQPPDILWIHWRVYDSIANTSKGVLFLPPSDVYVRNFLYLLYTLIKLNYTKAPSNQASSLALDWILLQRPRISAFLRGSATTFQYAPWNNHKSSSHLSSHRVFSLVMKNFKIHSLSNFQICNTVLLTRVAMLYMTAMGFTECICFITGSLYPWLLLSFNFFCPPSTLCLW